MPNKTIEDFAYQVRDYMRSAEVIEGKNLAYSQENNAVIATIENGKSYKVRWTGSATVTLKKNSASGTEVTSGSTSPLSFTADSDFDLYFGTSADVTEIMVYDGNDTSDTYEPYYVPVKDSMFKRSEQRILGAKNLLPNTATSTGIFTVRSDGSVLVNGTPSGTAILAIYQGALPEGELIYSGCPKGGEFMSTYQMDILDGSNAKAYDIGEGTVISRADFTNPDNLTFRIRIADGYQTNNMVFEPMIRLASDPDDTYSPYAITNRELTPVDITDQITWATGFTKDSSYTRVLKVGNELHCNIGGKFDETLTANTWGNICTLPLDIEATIFSVSTRTGISGYGQVLNNNKIVGIVFGNSAVTNTDMIAITAIIKLA